MNQRISIRAIVKNEGKILLARRSNGRESILGLFELPGGRVNYGEQPEDALRRYMHEDLGIHINTAKIYDVVTYIDKDDRDIQYAVIVFEVVVATGHHDIKLGDNYDEYIWGDSTIVNTQNESITDLTYLILGISRQDVSGRGVTSNDSAINDDSVGTVLYTDGGSRGNPGPSASGYIIIDKDKAVLSNGGEYLGITDNNQAEYQAVRLGLEVALGLGIKKLEVRIDSMLVVNQMNGVYRIKNRDLWPIHEKIKDILGNFDYVRFTHVPRDQNQLADAEVNKVLDQHASDSK